MKVVHICDIVISFEIDQNTNCNDEVKRRGKWAACKDPSDNYSFGPAYSCGGTRDRIFCCNCRLPHKPKEETIQRGCRCALSEIGGKPNAIAASPGSLREEYKDCGCWGWLLWSQDLLTKGVVSKSTCDRSHPLVYLVCWFVLFVTHLFFFDSDVREWIVAGRNVCGRADCTRYLHARGYLPKHNSYVCIWGHLRYLSHLLPGENFVLYFTDHPNRISHFKIRSRRVRIATNTSVRVCWSYFVGLLSCQHPIFWKRCWKGSWLLSRREEGGG